MNSETLYTYIIKNFFKVVLFVFFITVILFSQGFSQEKEEQKKGPPSSLLSVELPKDAEGFFKEADKLLENDPVGAIRLYERGLILKPDAWDKRKKLASLYEKQNQLDLAIYEYEAINKATGSKESFFDLIRSMEKANLIIAAKDIAVNAFKKYPDEPAFLYLSGELFYKSGELNEALKTLQEFIRLKPADGKAFFLMGSIYEKLNKPKEALLAYLRAGELIKNDIGINDAIKRFQAKTFNISDLSIFIPDGWIRDKDGLLSIEGSQRITFFVDPKGDPEKVAIKHAKDAMPYGLFSDEALKAYEEFRKSLKKETPPLPIPFIRVKNMEGKNFAKIVTVSTGEIAHSNIESSVAISTPYKDKVYIIAWRANDIAEKGEKILTGLLEQAIWLP